MVISNSLKDFYSHHKFTIWFVTFCFVMLVVGTINMNSLRRTNESTRAMFGVVINDLALIGELQNRMQEVRRQALYSLTTVDPNLQIEYAEESRTSDVTVLKLIENYKRSNVDNVKNKELSEKIASDWKAYLTTRNETISLILEGRTKEAVALDLKEGVPQFNRIHEDLQQIKEHYKEQSAKQISEEAATSNASYLEMMVLRFLTLILTAWAMFSVQKRLLDKVQKKAEQAEEARIFSEAIISSAGEGIFVCDRELRYRVWNRVMTEFNGIAAEEVIGKNAYDLFPFLKEQGVEAYHQRALSGERVTSPDFQGLLPNGTLAWRSATYSPHYNAKGEVIGLIGMVRDISEIYQKSEQLSEATAFTQTIIENAGEGVVVYDRNLNHVVWNQAMERFTGIPAADVLGKNAPMLFPWMISEGIDQQLEMALSGETVFSPDLYIELSGGGQWRSSVYSPQRNSKNEIVGVIGLISDVTQRKNDEQELQANAVRLEQSNRELQDFAFVASHDLQEPLRKIQAFGDRLKTKYGAALDETGLDYLARMQNAAARMQVLINDLLSFSRITSKAKPFEQVDLQEVAKAVVSDLEIRIEQTGAQVEIDPLPIIDADPTQMRQLIQNLLSNALKFQQADVKPHIKITAERVNSDASFCEITVADNGIGFEEKYLDRIFTLFQRLHGRSEYEGTGVGLAVCRKIVERHGGQITAHSAPQQGAKFIISLPSQQWKEALSASAP